jgi:NrS-1  polymerase HBD domain
MVATPAYATMSRGELIEIIEVQQQTIRAEREKRQWYEQVLANKQLPTNQRLTLIAVKRLEETHKPDEKGWTRAHLPALGETVGISASSISRGLKQLHECTDVLKEQVRPDANDPCKSTVFVKSTDLIFRPLEVIPTKEIKRHGGDHRMICTSCGSDDIVEKRQHICRGCGTVLKTFDLRELNSPLQDATDETAENEPGIISLQDATGTCENTEELSLPPLQNAIGEVVPHCNLQPLLSHSVCIEVQSEPPAFLRNLPIWACHRAKVPFNAKRARSPQMAKSNDPATWTTYEQAKDTLAQSQAWKIPYDGLVFACNGEFTVIDLDHCLDEQGVMGNQTYERITAVNSYAEVSYGGLGIHQIALGTIPRGIKRSEIEMYCTGRFLTWTGKHLQEMPGAIEQRQAQVTTLFTEIAPPEEERREPARSVYTPCSLPGERILEKARNGKNAERFIRLFDEGDITSYVSHSEADLALCNDLAYWTDDDPVKMDELFRQSKLYRPERWEGKARAGESYGGGTIRRAIEGRRND